MIKCPNCTAQLKFEVTDQKIKCDYCGSSFEPAELRASLNVASEKENVDTVFSGYNIIVRKQIQKLKQDMISATINELQKQERINNIVEEQTNGILN